MRYHFTYELTEDDYIEFNRVHVETSPIYQKTLKVLRFLPLIALAGLLILLFMTAKDLRETLIKGTTYLVLCGVWFFAYKNQHRRALRRRLQKNVARLKKHGKLPFSRQVQITFDGTGITEVTENATNITRYAAMEKIVEGPQALYLYTNMSQAYLLPLYIFSSECKKSGFVQYVRDMQEQDGANA